MRRERRHSNRLWLTGPRPPDEKDSADSSAGRCDKRFGGSHGNSETDAPDPGESPAGGTGRPWSAHQAREEQWNRYLRNALLCAALVHVGIVALWPEDERTRNYLELTTATQLIALAPAAEIEIPQPDPSAPRPRVPTMESTPEAPAALDLDLDVDFRLDEQDLLPDFYEQLSFELPPPTIRDETPDLSRFVRYARNMSRPRISNMGEVEVFLQHHYRPLAEATGLRGEVLVYFWIDELGLVEKALVYRTSGSIALDELAVELTDIVKFRPAQHRGSPVAVRVMMPIVFQAT